MIALTHMRTPNDIKLAENCDEIDIILGGHDHVYEIKQINNKYIIKSGTDFRQFSKITINFEKPEQFEVQVEEINVTSEYAEDPILNEKLEKYKAIVEGKMDEVLGCFSVPLDGRFTSIRTSESNLGNWVSVTTCIVFSQKCHIYKPNKCACANIYYVQLRGKNSEAIYITVHPLAK